MSHFQIGVIFAVVVLLLVGRAPASAFVWIEAEHLDGIEGYCWPMSPPDSKQRQTSGHFGLSGPGWAAEWNQGGESGFLSIAAGGNDDKAAASSTITLPVAGDYTVWVRYGDWRESAEPFEIEVSQPGRPAQALRYGEAPAVEEDNVMKLYWNWAFAWAGRPATMDKGDATITLRVTQTAPQPRQIDVIVVTNDADYLPLVKNRPANPAWRMLDSWRDRLPSDIEPLARRTGGFAVPDSWQVRTFKDDGFLYLWNVPDLSGEALEKSWLGSDPDRVKHPHNTFDPPVLEAFMKKYAGADEVPIFSDPRIVPTFHAVGPQAFETDPKTGDVRPQGQLFAAWLDAHPNRPWATMMNYHPDTPVGEKGVALFETYRDRYVGSISGESLGYYYPDAAKMREATQGATTRRQLVEAFSPYTVELNQQKQNKVFGRAVDNAYADVISCMSVGNIVFGPLLADWGVRTVGYESAAATATVLPMRWAFTRGLARQRGLMTATYRSSNFGDSATLFAERSIYTKPGNIYDNYYSVYSGAGMAWYKFDIWYQYMAGSSMFYHEQGFDEYWLPGGLTAGGKHPLELSPKGKLVDRFLRVTADDFDRGTPFTPIAFLVDYAHGWEPSPYWPNSFKNWHAHEKRFRYGIHEKMLHETFWTAYHPIGPMSETPITGTSEVILPGVFGDIFDVIFAYPDTSKWATIDTYPVVYAVGEIELTEAEGSRINQYIQDGGTFVMFGRHLSGPGAAKLPAFNMAALREADSYHWLAGDDANVSMASGLFAYHPLEAQASDRVLATSSDGSAFAISRDVGKGRIIVASVPHGLTIGGQAHPVQAQLLAHLARGLMPVEVDGDVNWLVSRSKDSWLVTLLNPAGQAKPQQGITPTDYRENRRVVIRSHVPVSSAVDRLLPSDKLSVSDNRVELTVPAGSLRIIELSN